jgi:hypothetical protein
MSVSSTFTLPNNPPGGVLAYVPLGGNGYTDPFAMYVLRNWVLSMDASGGNAELEVVMDDRFCSMVAFASMISSNTAVDPAAVRWTLGSGVTGSTPLMARAREFDLLPAAVTSDRLTDTWLPPAFVIPGADFCSLTVTTENDAGFAMQLFASIFLYNINARQKVPYSHLVQARGGVGDSN